MSSPTEEFGDLKLKEILAAHEKYLKHIENTKKAYKKYSESEKGKLARRKAMKAFRERQKNKTKKKQNS